MAYLRVSTDKQAERGTSLEAQREAIAAYAKLYGLDVVAWVEDGGESAKSLDRPGLAQALSMLDAGQADGLIVSKLDRLTRSVRDLGELMDTHFGTGRCGLLSVGEQVDTRTATGRMVLNVITTISQWERERIGERVASMHAVKRQRGERVGAPAYGYRVAADGRTLEPCPEEQATVTRIRAQRASGASIASIAGGLNAEAVPARGGRWHATTVARILSR